MPSAQIPVTCPSLGPLPSAATQPSLFLKKVRRLLRGPQGPAHPHHSLYSILDLCPGPRLGTG
jgi:hypothetical protein